MEKIAFKIKLIKIFPTFNRII